VANRGNVRIEVYNSNGDYLRQIKLDVPVPAGAQPAIGNPLAPNATPGTQSAGAPWALCITPGPNQVLYASDAFPGRIYKVSLDGKILGVLGKAGKQLKQFGWIHEIRLPIRERAVRRRDPELAGAEAAAAAGASVRHAVGDPVTDAAALPLHDTALRRHQIRAVVSASIGTTIEWYDFFLYGVAAASVFPQKFFPASDPFVATMLSFTTFFLGFVARPIGAAIFGHFGDRVGRKKLLVVTMIVMGASTMAVGLTPGYDVIGIWGAVLLTIGRVLQGLAIGGQWSGSVLMAAEWTDPKRRGFTTSFAQLGAPGGMVLANGALALMTGLTSDQAFLDWGWRVPFLASVALVITGFYIRSGVQRNTGLRGAEEDRRHREGADRRRCCASHGKEVGVGHPASAPASRCASTSTRPTSSPTRRRCSGSGAGWCSTW
jgi:hypothetical protein